MVSIQGKPELTNFAAGFSKAVDPLSGMTVNLRDIMIWLEQWKEQCSDGAFTSWLDFLAQAHQFFSKHAQLLKAQASAVQVKFFDQSLLRWNVVQFSISIRGPIVDNLARLRICELHFRLSTESDFERVRDFILPSELPGSFDEPELFLAFFESKLGLPLEKAEIQDPETKVSAIFP